MSLRKQTTERSRDKTSYGLYCVNIYGTGLNTIKNEFIRQVRTGLRQTVFIIDLDDVQKKFNNEYQNTQELKDNSNMYLINAIVQHVQEFRKQYDTLTKIINEELNFNLYQYWLKPVENNREMFSVKSKERETKPAKKRNSVKWSRNQENKTTFNKSIINRAHNRVGQKLQLSKIKYIRDEPILGKLYIIILGQMNKHFYADLLRHDEPLEGIINFVPAESNYDIMLGNNKLKNFILATMNTINYSIYQIRQEVDLNPVGLFIHSLPVISDCLATKYARQIFDQLTWSIFDIEILKQQYYAYYYKPFQITNVAMPANINLKDLYHMARTSNTHMQEQSLESNLTKCGTNLATIASYLNILLNTCSLPKGTLEEHDRMYNLVDKTEFKNSFSSITKIDKWKRIIVDENNQLLLSMIQHMDQNIFQSIYSCCLNYNIFRKYIFFTPKSVSLNHRIEDLENIKSFILPQYMKYYANTDCCSQRISQLIDEYDDYKIDQIEPGYKMYTFKIIYNILREKESTVILPTRLCFRDFTLFQMDEFLQNLKALKQNQQAQHVGRNSINYKKSKILEFNENIFIRLNSLKALQKEISHKEIKYQKTGHRSSRNKMETKSSTIINDQWEGLPPDHPLLKGYNLEDTLQEVKFKTSKYHYSHGFVQLYEEKWCFQDMNKQLTFNINNTTLIFNKPRHQLKGLSNNIRMITNNDIQIRILNEYKEYSKIIMNYPNGLNIFCHENFCEQNRDEQRRIYTPYGSIIVFFKANDVILIMRYNGEVYHLLQHEVKEEEVQSLTTQLSNNFHDQSSVIIDMKISDDTLFFNENIKNYKVNRISKDKATGDNDRDKMKQRQSKELLKEESLNHSTKDYLKEFINNELSFLDFLSSTYNLNYLHLVVTTSQGRRININSQGKIFEDQPYSVQEWRDYFANEDYCERSDGVKMIWTKDYFKCYHKDGSVFTTTTEEGLANLEMDDDDFELQIPQNSAHNGQEIYVEKQQNISFSNSGIQQSYTKLLLNKICGERVVSIYNKCLNLWNKHFNYTRFITNETSEQDVRGVPEDTQYISYSCNSWFMQHRYYAGVYVLNSNLYSSSLPIKIEIFGVDNIRLYMDAEPNDSTEYNSEIPAESGEERKNNKSVVNVWIGENLHIIADEETCGMYGVMTKSDASKNIKKSNSLTLRLKYTDCIHDAFKYLVNEIASYENCNEFKMKELYFIEKINNDSSIRGFEFFTSLPLNSQYSCQVNNIITELKPVITINEKMSNNFIWYKNDMNKFPRFKQQRQHKTSSNPEDEFPYVLCSNIYVDIPKILRNIGNITKFLEPFEDIYFKKFRNNIKNVLNFYLKPESKVDLKNLSTKNWKKQHCEYERRLFMEQQRLDLYRAMNTHKIYPNYWKFIYEYKGQVGQIDFFDFMQNKYVSKEE